MTGDEQLNRTDRNSFFITLHLFRREFKPLKTMYVSNNRAM